MNLIHRIPLLVILIGITACSTTLPVQPQAEPVLNQFQSVWNEVAVDPVTELPQERVSFGKLVAKGKNVILGNATRTLKEHANILEPFDKLAHPNGICFKGMWAIDTSNRYGGYFKMDSQGLIIVRASTAMSNTKRGETRAFGFAGKLFPTVEPGEIIQENAASFFLIDDLGGTKAARYTDVALSNEPDATLTSVVFKNLLYVLKVARTFAKVDKNPGIRQVYEISQLGEIDKKAVITPRWMKVDAKEGQTVEADDFREELQLKNDKALVFSISVASDKIDKEINWQAIGSITLDTSVVSKSCDHRLHFHHPVWETNLNH